MFRFSLSFLMKIYNCHVADTVISIVQVLTHVIFTKTLFYYYYQAHFTEEETEVE